MTEIQFGLRANYCKFIGNGTVIRADSVYSTDSSTLVSSSTACRYECIRVLLEHMFSSEVPSNICEESVSVAASGCNSTSSAALPPQPDSASSNGEGKPSTSDVNANLSADTNGDGPVAAAGSGAEQTQADAAAASTGPEQSTQISDVNSGGSTECAKKQRAPVSAEVLACRRQSVFVNGFQVLYVLLDLRKPLLDPTGGLGEMGLGRGEGGFGLGAFSSDLPPAGSSLPNGSGNQPLIALEPAKVRALLHNVVRALRPYFGRLSGVFDMPLSV